MLLAFDIDTIKELESFGEAIEILEQ